MRIILNTGIVRYYDNENHYQYSGRDGETMIMRTIIICFNIVLILILILKMPDPTPQDPSPLTYFLRSIRNLSEILMIYSWFPSINPLARLILM